MRAARPTKWFARRIADTWYSDPPTGFLATRHMHRHIWSVGDRLDDFARRAL